MSTARAGGSTSWKDRYSVLEEKMLLRIMQMMPVVKQLGSAFIQVFLSSTTKIGKVMVRPPLLLEAFQHVFSMFIFCRVCSNWILLENMEVEGAAMVYVYESLPYDDQTDGFHPLCQLSQ